MRSLRRFFPSLSPCPACGVPDQWRHLGQTKGGGTQYRLCTCGRKFKVVMIAEEVVLGDGTCRIVLVGARPA